MKDLALPIPALNSGAAPVMGTHGEGLSLGLAGFLAWLRLWLACVAEGRLAYKRGSGASQSYRRPPSLLPESARAAVAPTLRFNRQLRRRKARGLPASRQYVGLHHLSARSLTIGQFLGAPVRYPPMAVLWFTVCAGVKGSANAAKNLWVS